MISHPSEYWENYTAGADTTSRADYSTPDQWADDAEAIV